jgi:hypothetical protein
VLGIRALDGIAKDPAVYPQFTDTLRHAMREETMLVIEEIVWRQNGDARELFTAPWTFVNAELAGLYGIAAPEGDGFAKVALPPDQPRAGVLGHASFLSTFSHFGSTSPTLRGKAIRNRLLCQSIPAPPPDVPTDLPSTADAQTMRERLIAHQAVASCAGCHKLMDPLGLSLENFDGIGAYRQTENGFAIDTSGELDGAPFADPRGLAALLAADPDVAACTVKNVFRHAFGHVETQGERTSIALLEEAFVASGHRLRELLVDMVSSEVFRLVAVEQ